MAEELKMFPSTDVDFEVLNDGQMVAIRFRSEAGTPAYAVVPVDLLKKFYTHIPTVLGIASDARKKAGIVDAATAVTLPEIHALTRVEFGLMDSEPDKVCLLFELNHAMTLPTKANREWITEAIQFVQGKLTETAPEAS